MWRQYLWLIVHHLHGLGQSLWNIRVWCDLFSVWCKNPIEVSQMTQTQISDAWDAAIRDGIEGRVSPFPPCPCCLLDCMIKTRYWKR